MKLSRSEARDFEMLGKFDVFTITLKAGHIPVLGDTLSRGSHAKEAGVAANDVVVLLITFDNVVLGSGDIHFSEPIVMVLRDECPETRSKD